MRTPAGGATLFYRSQGSQQSVLHPIEGTQEKARTWWVERTSGDVDLCVFHGLGLGYHIPSIIEEADKGVHILIVESDPLTFSLCLALADCTRVLSHENISIVLEPNSTLAGRRTSDWLGRFKGERRIRFLIDPPAMAAQPIFLRDWFDSLAKLVPSFSRILLKSLHDNYPKPENFLESWPILEGRPGVGRLFGKMAGSPMVVVGAGPGLEELLPPLLQAQDRLLVIACDTIVRRLLDSGIRVDVAVAADSSPKNHEHLMGLSDTGFLPVYYAGAHPPLLAEYQDSLWVCSISPFPTAEHLESGVGPLRYLRNKGRLVLNQTVGTTAVDLAIQLGGDPIFLAGMDLAYCGGKHHISGTIYDRADEFRSTQPGLFEVPSVDGGTVETNTAFLVSLIGLGHQIETAHSVMYNLSREGGVIAGAGGWEEGLAALTRLPQPSGEPPCARLSVERDLAEKELHRPLRRLPVAAGDLSKVIDNRGRWRTEIEPGLMQAVALENLEALRKTHPELADRVHSRMEIFDTRVLARGEGCQWLRTQQGYPVIIVTDSAGQTISVTPSSGSPWGETAEYAGSQSEDDSPALIHLGLCDGRHVRQALEEPSCQEIWVWEPYLDRFLIGLGIAALVDLFSDPRIRWAVGMDAAALLSRMEESGGTGVRELPMHLRPWVFPGFRVWARSAESEFIEAWMGWLEGR